MAGYPRTIDNGAGERLTFREPRSDDRGEYQEARNVVSPGAGPPMRVHHIQEESLTVERGAMGWERANREQGIAQTRPPDNLEYYLTRIYGSMRAKGGKRPRMFDAAYLTTRYRSEFGMGGIPASVQRVVFPVVVAIGRLFGKHRRFADAPKPVRR